MLNAMIVFRAAMIVPKIDAQDRFDAHPRDFVTLPPRGNAATA